MERIAFLFIYSFGFLYLAGSEWWRFASPVQKPPYAVTAFALIFMIFAIIKAFQWRKQLRNLRLGLEGERAVGQYLDLFREKGARIFHDLQGDGFNVDHVIIAPQGIFVVETKTRSKPVRGEARISVKDDRLFANGFEIERNPLTQARALNRWVSGLLKETTGKHYPVQSVILFPGWFVEPESNRAEVWVLNPKALPAFVENQAKKLTPQDLHLAAFHLSRFIRTAYQ